MKILLLQPPLTVTNKIHELEALDDDDNTLVSMGLYSIGAVLLENGYDVRLINQTKTIWHYAIDECVQFEPDMVGITCLSHNRHTVLQLADTLKEKMPSTRITLGGVHASSLFSLILRKHPSVDYIAIGEGEYSFLELCRRINAGESTSGIKGIVQRRPGVDYQKEVSSIRVREGCTNAYADFDWAGPADTIKELGELPIMAKYYNYSFISTARGCPFNCTFCSSPQIWGQNVRNRPIEHVIEELKLLRDKYGARVINFKDETFTMSKKRVVELCKAIIDAELNLIWTCDTRTDCLNDNVLHWMRKAGCYYVSVGIESGSEAMLAQIDKKTDLKKIRTGTALLRKYGFMIRYYIIANLPEETSEDRQASIDIIEECKPQFVSVSLLKLSPNTELYRRFCQEFNKDDNIWFDDVRFWIPYYEDSQWIETGVGKKLLAYRTDRGNKTPNFPYTEDELRDIQSRVSDCFGTNYDLAQYLLAQKRFAEALDYYQLALKYWPDSIYGLHNLSVCLLNLDRVEESKEILIKLCQEYSDEPAVWFHLGMANSRLGAHPQAEENFRKVLALQRNSVPALNQLGRVLANQSKATEALEVLQKALALKPGDHQVITSMAQIHQALGNHKFVQELNRQLERPELAAIRPIN